MIEASSRRSASLRVAEVRPPAAVRDRRERGAQVVGDGAQERGLDHVAAPQRLGLDHLILELAAPPSGAHQRLECRDHPILEGGEDLRIRARRHQHRADPAAPDDQRKRATAVIRVHPGQLHRHAGQVVRLGDPLGHGPERFLAGGSPEQQSRHLRREVGLAPPALRLLGALARRSGQRARHERGDQEHRQRHQVLALGYRELARGRDVEVVPGRGAQDRGEDPQPEAPVGGDQQDGEHVDHAGGHHRHELAQAVDRPCGERDRADRHQGAAGQGTPAAHTLCVRPPSTRSDTPVM